jgi:hypothetical protein
MKSETVNSHFKTLMSAKFLYASISRVTCFGSRGSGVRIPPPRPFQTIHISSYLDAFAQVSAFYRYVSASAFVAAATKRKSNWASGERSHFSSRPRPESEATHLFDTVGFARDRSVFFRRKHPDWRSRYLLGPANFH